MSFLTSNVLGLAQVLEDKCTLFAIICWHICSIFWRKRRRSDENRAPHNVTPGYGSYAPSL